MKRIASNVLEIAGEGGRIARIWVRDAALVEEQALNQVRSMLGMPQLFEHLAVMPDVHWGLGATIGAVMALTDAVVPNCVGVDIGCGMAAYPLGLRYEGEFAARGFWRGWLSRLHELVPTGFSCHGAQPETLKQLAAWSQAERGEEASVHRLRCASNVEPASKFKTLNEMVLRQTGTLGGGNHFLEIQRDQEGMLWLMLHSGSRNIGLKIAKHYGAQAKRLNKLLGQTAPMDLNFLPLNTPEGAAYLHDMQWAVDYALLNRKVMLHAALKALELLFDEGRMINIPHNYAAEEEHFGRHVVVHRKGATSARVGELGIIPGSMGTPSYIVRGLGNPASYSSCSHGAGRAMGRKQARRVLTGGDFAAALKDTFSVAGAGYLDEAPQAYKDIDLVLNAQDDLVTVVHKLEPVITLKSGDDSVD